MCYKMLHGVTGCCMVLHGVTGCYMVLDGVIHGVRGCYTVLQGVKKNLSFLSSFGLRAVFVKGSKIAVFVSIVTSKQAL